MADREEKRQELAEERTDWAEDRTVLANERTFSSWMGTGLGCLGLAIGLQAVFGAVEPTWLAKLVASSFILIAIIIFLTAFRNATQMKQRLDSHCAEPAPNRHLGTIVSFLCIVSVLVGLVLWLV